MTQPLTRAEATALLTGPGLPFEVEPVIIAGAPMAAYKNAPRSLRELYADNVSDRCFLVYDDERLTFRQVQAEAGRVARVLRDVYGVAKGDRVAISMRNYPEWVLAFAAATSLGAIVVPLNALWQPDEMEFALRDCGARVLFADQERLARLSRCSADVDVSVIAVRAESPRARSLTSLLEGAPYDGMPDADVAPDDPATIFYTSGSSGHPKGVVSSHRNILAALMTWELDIAAVTYAATGAPPTPPAPPAPGAPQAATLLGVPLFHVSGSHAVYLQSYRAQRKVVAMYKWDPEVAAELIERERITALSAPPAMTGDLLRVYKTTTRDLSSLASLGGGGASRAPEQVKQIGERASPGTGWGMTETNGIGTMIWGADYLARPASAGQANALVQLKVIDEDGNEVRQGERGELLMRGPTVFPGYWNRPDVNAEVFMDGWLRTGDVAYLDEEGFVFIVDRIKDLIIRGGENIGCGAVEAALLAHPQVREAAVYSVPDERLGEEVGATVYAEAGLDADALRAFLRERLAAFEVPRYLRFQAEPLPRIASGKIFKRQLRSEAVSALQNAPRVDA